MQSPVVALTLPQAIAKAAVLADAPTAQDAEFMSDLMIASAGVIKDTTTVIYRYYYVAARRLQTNLEAQAITEDSGTKLTGYALPIQTLLNLQLAIDTGVPLDVPVGFSAAQALNELCGCGSGGSGGAAIMSAFVI